MRGASPLEPGPRCPRAAPRACSNRVARSQCSLRLRLVDTSPAVSRIECGGVEDVMRVTTGLVTAAVMLLAATGSEAQKKPAHLNPMIELHAQKRSIFGLYAPSNPRGRGNRGAAPGAPP